MYLRILYKIHVFGFMSQHLCISGSSARSMSPDPYISIHMYLRILWKIHVSGFMAQHPYVSQDSLQDPRLRIHVSASSYLRILCKIHVSDSCLSIHVSASMCISGSSARSMSPDPYLSSHMYLRILYKIHVFGFMSQHLRVSRILCKIHVSGFMSQHLSISGSSARSMSPGSCLSIFASQDPLQDPCLRIHVSASSYLRLLCKIHVSDSCRSVHQNGSSTRSTSSDSCLSIFVSHGFSARFTSPDSCLSIFISQEPLQDPCLRIHVSDSGLSIHQYGSSARSMSSDSCLSIFVSQDALQDPCLRIHVSAAICISGSSTRSTSSDSCLSIFVSQAPPQDPCLRIRI